MNNLVNSICQKVFSETPREVFAILDKGHANLVYKVTVPSATYILRIDKNGSGLKTYTKEKWCMEKAAAQGIPTAQCVALGIHENHAYSFQTYIEGKDGADRPEEHDRIWFTLGKYAKLINQIPVHGYGEDLKFPEKDDFGNPWKGVIEYSIDWLFEDDFFVKEKILSESQVEKIKARLTELYSWDFSPVLCHSNLAPKNTIVHPDGTIYLIDWGTAMSHRAPHLELSEVLTWDYEKKHEDAYMKGYGITPDEYSTIARDVETLVILRLVDSIKWGYQKKEDWKNVDFVRNSINKINRMIS